MFDFQKVWTLLDIILKVAQTGSTELHNIVTAANDELKTIHNELGAAKAATPATTEAPTAQAIPATVYPSGSQAPNPTPDATPTPAPASTEATPSPLTQRFSK